MGLYLIGHHKSFDVNAEERNYNLHQSNWVLEVGREMNNSMPKFASMMTSTVITA